MYKIPNLPLPFDLETKAVLKQVNKANQKLAELKGIAHVIPNENILISSLTLQEAKDSSEVENIVTTQDELYKAGLDEHMQIINASTKEVLRYREAIMYGFAQIRKGYPLSCNLLKRIQGLLVDNDEGFRKVPGTALKSSADGRVVYMPPQNIDDINAMMSSLEKFINVEEMYDYDPLVKMAIIHHQFESIHPFGDGNGRTGRILNILYLVQAGMLDIPILYLSRFITHNKSDYYRLLQAIREKNTDNEKEWEEWILFMLKGVEETSQYTIELINGISTLMQKYKNIIRPQFGKKYKHELLNNLFFHPYTKVDYFMRDMMVARNTATKYLDDIVEMGLLDKVRRGKENYYINTGLVDLFVTKG
ncbi:MAG: Fic family protein, partial [Prevotella sp.]